VKITYSQEQIQRMCACPCLTDRERRVLKWYYRRGWHIEDIAVKLNRDRRTVDRILSSIREKTRDVVETPSD